VRVPSARKRLLGLWTWAWLFALVLGLHFRSALAQAERSLELSWATPGACQGEAAVRQRIAGLAPAPAARELPLRVEGKVEQREDGLFVLELVLADGELTDRRRFEGNSCDEVVGAAAVAIALLLRSPDETGDVDGVSTDASGDKSTESSATASPPVAAPTVSDEPWQIVVEVPSLVAGVGFLSRPSWGTSLGVGVEFEAWRVVLAGTWNLELALPIEGSADASAEVSRQTLRLSSCRWVLSGRFQVAPCATVGAQRVVARAAGPEITSAEVSYGWIVFGPSAAARFRLGENLGLRAGVGVDIQAAHPALAISGLGDVEQIGAVETTAIVGAEWIF
jgi:hypothetical protein